MSNPFSRLVSRSRCTFALRFPWKTGALTTDYESSIRKIVEIAARALVFLGRNRQQCCSRRASIRMHRAFAFRTTCTRVAVTTNRGGGSSSSPCHFQFLPPLPFPPPSSRVVERTKSWNKFASPFESDRRGGGGVSIIHLHLF